MSSGRLIKKTGLYFIGNLSSKIVSAAILPIYAFFVTPEALGTFDFVQIWGNVFAPVCYLAIWEAVLKYLITTEDDKTISKYISSILLFILFAVLVSITIGIVLLKVNIIENLNLILLMMLTVGLAQIWQYFARALKFNSVYVAASISGTIINFFLLIVLVCFLRLNLFGLMFSFLCGQLAIVLIIELKCHILTYFSLKLFDKSFLKKALLYSTPLVLNLTSLWILNGFGRTLINNRLGAEMNGLYTFALKFGTLVSMLGSVVSMALCEEIIIKINDPDISEYFSNVNTKLFNLFLTIAILAAPMVTVFYHIIGETDYFASLQWAPFFLFNAVISVMSTNIGNVFPAKGKTNLTFTTTLAGAIVTMILGYTLIEYAGVMGVALAQISGSLTMMICRWLYANKLIHAKIKLKKIISLTLIFIVISVVSIHVDIIVNFVVFLISAILCLCINKTEIVEVIDIFANKIKKREH